MNTGTSDTRIHATGKAQRTHASPWQKIYDDMQKRQRRNLATQEQITPFITPPWRQGPEIHIDETADKARERHDREKAKGDSLSIYTDGSVIAAFPPFSNSSLNPRHAHSKVQVTLPPRPIQVGPERVYRQHKTYIKRT